MKNRVGITLAIIGLIFFNYAEGWGADWKLFDGQESASQKFYDPESIIATPEGNIRVWELITMPFQHENVAIRYKCLYEFNCTLREYRHLLTEEMYPNKGFLEKEGDKKWSNIVPESPMDKFYKVICGKGKK